MKNKLYFVILIFFFLSANFSKANELKRAYSALEKGDYKTAIYFSYYTVEIRKLNITMELW